MATPAPMQASMASEETSGESEPSTPTPAHSVPTPGAVDFPAMDAEGDSAAPDIDNYSIVPDSEDGWSPTHDPSWVLGPQHRDYVHSAASFLIGVPGGPEWEKLLASYITYEGLSSFRSVSVFLSAYQVPSVT